MVADADLVHAITQLLDVSGFTSDSISHGGDALKEKVCASSPDHIFLDVLLSNEDGRDTARTLKSTDATKHIPIIMVSALPAVEDSALEAGADHFVAKPFDIMDSFN